MVNNYFTLICICDEVRDKLTGSRLVAAVTKTKSTLELFFVTTDGGAARLVVSCAPRKNFLYVEFQKSIRGKGANVLHEAVGKVVRSIGPVEYQREVIIEFMDGTSIRARLFGSSANVFFLDSGNAVVTSFLKTDDRAREKIVSTPGNVKHFPDGPDDLRSNLSQNNGSTLRNIPKVVSGFDLFLSREALFRFQKRMCLSDQSTVEKLELDTTSDLETLLGILHEMRNELSEPRPRIYTSEGYPVAFSIIPIGHVKFDNSELFDSFNECVRKFVGESERVGNIGEVRKEVVAKLTHKLDALRRTMIKIEEDISNNRSERYQAAGERLMANLDEIPRGTESITIELPEGKFEAHLDLSLTTLQNAQHLFEKSKRARASSQQAKERKKSIVREIEKVERLINDAERSVDLKFLGSISKSVIKDDAEHLPFRVFEKAGYKIYVGKDAKSNDQLTFGFARPNDVFLHARGVSGSHVIIRNPSRDYPDKRVLEYAASLAAHYSKARTSSVVPVSYTMRKYLKKAKGVPGAVVINREEVLFVDSEAWRR